MPNEEQIVEQGDNGQAFLGSYQSRSLLSLDQVGGKG